MILSILFCMLFFILGFILGRVETLFQYFKTEKPESFITNLRKEEKNRKKVSIDETKFVTEVSTDELESNNNQKLGIIHKSEDNIKSATNKLAQLKKLKG